MIAIDQNGTELVEFLPIQESEIRSYHPLEFAVTLIKYQDKFLLVFDTYKNHWEVPGGSVEAGESARACAIRELKEEACQVVDHLKFNGLISIKMADSDELIYGGVFSGILETAQQFEENDEISEITFWDRVTSQEINAIDKVLLGYFDVAQE